MNLASATCPRTLSDRLPSWIKLSSSTVVLCCSLLVLLFAGKTLAGVTTAISPTGGTDSTANLGTVITSGSSTASTPLCTASCVITGGTRAGNNLYHSFGNFNIGALDSARFQTGLVVNPPPDMTVSNILARVTGGTSSIFGNLNSATYYPSANLFLINPAGFLFGPNASINVGGMVAFTTADYLRFADSLRFNAVPNAAADAPLSTAPVVAYGFLGSNPGAITVQGSQFSVTDGQSISLVGGNITIQSGTLDNGTVQPARLSAPNSTIQLASAASPGEFDAATLQPLPNVANASFTSFGSVTLAPGSNINVSGTNTVSIRGGQFVLSVNDAVLTTYQTAGLPETISLSPGSSIVTSNSGADPGADVQLIASNIQMAGASIQSLTTGDGSGGGISINGQVIMVTGGAQIASTSLAAGDGSPISLNASDGITVDNFSSISSSALSDGHAGNIHLSARNVTLDSGFILTTASGNAAGGNLSITASEAVELRNGSLLFSSTDSTQRGGDVVIQGTTVAVRDGSFILSDTQGAGHGGNITIHATESLLITSPADSESPSTIMSTAELNSSNGGAVDLSASSISIGDSGAVITQAAGSARGGNITLRAENDLTMTNTAMIESSTAGSGPSGAIAISAGGTLSLVGNFDATTSSRIVNRSASFLNDAGANSGISMEAGTLLLKDGARIISDTVNATGGDVTILAHESVQLSDGSRISIVNTLDNIGSLSISAPSITIDGQGTGLNTRTIGSGNAGDISLNATAGNIVLSGGSDVVASTEQSDGRGGTITANATGSVMISGGSSLQSNSFRPGPSGSILVTAGDTVSISDPGSGLFTEARGSGSGGAVLVKSNQIQVTDGAIISAKSMGSGAAGNVTIEGAASPAQSVLIDGAGSGIVTTTSSTGAGGNISISAQTFTLQNGGTLSAKTSGTAVTATGGDITVRANQVEIKDGGVMTAQSTGVGDAGNITVQGLASPAQSIRVAGVDSGLFTETRGTGTGGNITTWANEVRLTDHATVSSKTTSSGNAGNILVKADTFRMEGGATITAASTGSGNAGTVTIQGTNSPANSVVIEGTGTGIFTDTQDSGKGGDITIETKTLTMQNGGTISAATSGLDEAATGGNVRITASQSVDLRNNASISARSTGEADAGNITINAGNRFEARNSSMTTKSENAGGGNIEINALDQFRLVNSHVNASAFLDGGNITIDPNVVVLQHSQILAQAIQGAGGNITITTPLFLADSSSLVSASSQFGLNGTVTIQSPTSNLSGSLGTLPSNPSQEQVLVTQRCAALVNGQASSFVVAGREQLPADPGGWLTSSLALAGIDAARFGDGTVAEGTSNLAPRTSGLLANDRVSLRRLTPPGFLIANFADSEATGCHS